MEGAVREDEQEMLQERAAVDIQRIFRGHAERRRRRAEKREEAVCMGEEEAQAVLAAVG